MSYLRAWSLAAALMVPFGAFASSDFSAEGKYELVQPPQPTETGDNIEVLDVFWYGCPHCYRFLPVMDRYKDAKPEHVEIRRMPAIFRESWMVHARAFYTAEILGVTDEVHPRLFAEIHTKKRLLDTRESLADFFATLGVSKEDFEKTYDSFAVDSMVRKSMVMQKRYGVNGTPSVIVNGKYRVSGSLAGSYENMLKVIEVLVDKEIKERNNSS